mmetsp:Transcript_24114/g.58238  ORF Transcript_24114/g.58238 Transcript_24114/m.58238 type:complete len:311 (+) Transcript_24114:77-1009(+)
MTSSPTRAFVVRDNLHLSRRVQHALTGLALLVVSYVISPFPVGFVLLSLATGAFYYVHWKRVHDEAWDIWYLDRFGSLLREHERGEWEEAAKRADDSADGGSRKPQNKKLDNKPRRFGNDCTNNGRRRKTPPALPGAFYFLLGTTLSTLTFPTIVARTSLLILSIADPAAAVVGVLFGERLGWNITWKKFFRRMEGMRGRGTGESGGDGGGGGPSVAGSIACAVTAIICTAIYIPSSANINANGSTVPTSARGGSIYLSPESRLCIGVITAMTEAIAGRNLPVIGTKMADDNLLIPLVVGSFICWLNEYR